MKFNQLGNVFLLSLGFFVGLIFTSPIPSISLTTQSSLQQHEGFNEIRVTEKKERNWLLTKAWLIDNINRLRHELNELARDYNQHIETSSNNHREQQKQLVLEIATIRADHTVLSQQQNQIIQLIKGNQIHNSESNSIPQINELSSTTTTPVSIHSNEHSPHHVKRHKRRHSRHTHSHQHEHHQQVFEEQTQRNITELYSQVVNLHDITVSLFHELQNLDIKFGDKSEQSSIDK
jgi:hypothetical protein